MLALCGWDSLPHGQSDDARTAHALVEQQRAVSHEAPHVPFFDINGRVSINGCLIKIYELRGARRVQRLAK
jgi:hypothetical protein